MPLLSDSWKRDYTLFTCGYKHTPLLRGLLAYCTRFPKGYVSSRGVTFWCFLSSSSSVRLDEPNINTVSNVIASSDAHIAVGVYLQDGVWAVVMSVMFSAVAAAVQNTITGPVGIFYPLCIFFAVVLVDTMLFTSSNFFPVGFKFSFEYIMSRPKTSSAGVACVVVWYVDRIA